MAVNDRRSTAVATPAARTRGTRRPRGGAPRRRSLASWAGLACLATLAGATVPASAWAGDDPPPPPPPRPRASATAPDDFGDPTDPAFRGAILGDSSSSEVDDASNERVLTAVGGISQGVWVRLDGFELRCESAVFWGDRDRLVGALESREKASAPDLLGNVIYAAYAEGKVLVRRDKYTFHADRVFLDFRNHRATLVNAVIQSDTKSPSGKTVPIVVRASLIRGVARDRFRAENATLSSCTFEHPHLAFTTSEVEVDFSRRQPRYETGWWPTMRADTLVAESVPLLPLPKLGGSLGGRPVQKIEFSNSNRFGVTAGLGFGGEFERDDGTSWGTWQVIPRIRTKRGPGLGLEIEHDGEPAQPGRPADQIAFEGEFQRDGADEDSFSERPFDGQRGGRSASNRGRGTFWTRQILDEGLAEGWRLDAEASWSSDRGYLAEYDSDVVLREKPQETFVQLRRARGNQGFSALASYRLQDEAYFLDRSPATDPVLTTFAYQTDWMPSVTWHLMNEPVVPYETTGFAPLNLSVEAQVAHAERRLDETLAERIERKWGWESRSVVRGDLETRVTAPFEVGAFQVTPAFGASVYHVSDANGYANAGTPEATESQGRGALYHSLRIGTEVHREFDAENDFLDLHGLRHVVSPDVLWFRRFHVSDERANEFQVHDLKDQLAEQDVVSFRLRNRLQTRREGETVDWLDYEARLLWYVQESGARRGGSLGVREDFASPLDRIDFPGEEKYLARDRDGSAFHQHRARVEMTPEFWLVGEADYDMNRSELESSGAGFRWFPDRRFSVYVGRRTIHDDSSIWTVRADYRLSDKWGFTGEFQDDTKNNRGLRTTLGLYRRSHDLTFAVEFESERLLDETGISFVVYPHDWLVRKNDPFSRRRPLDYSALRWYR